jgi:hypothetical protein
MSVDSTEEVEVLYDYSYNDDQGEVQIRHGEKYRLVERTNSEWWHVCALDQSTQSTEDSAEGIFVPAQYVRVVKTDDDVKSALSSLDSALDEENVAEKETEAPAKRPREPNLQRQPVLSNGTGKSADTETDYVNLDQYRADAKISTAPDVRFARL